MLNRIQTFCLGILILFVASCSKNNDSGKVSLAFISNGPADFWLYSQAGVEQAGRDLGIDVQFKVGDWTTAKQKQIVDDLLVSGTAGVAISPTNPKDQKMMINEWSSFIPVVCADSDSAGSKRVAFVGTDNVEAGRMCGELLKEALPQGGKVMVFVGLKDAHSAKTRYQGFQDSLKGSNIEIIDLRTDNGDRVKARKNAEDTITK